MCVGQEPEMCRSGELTDPEYLTEYIWKIVCTSANAEFFFAINNEFVTNEPIGWG